MSINLVNIIFGMKVRQMRTEAGLTLSQLAKDCDLSASYLTEIEKGRKYPRADKILRMADALHVDYDDLVSISLPPSLAYLEGTLSSSIMRRFPFEEFGLQAEDLITLLTREPEKASALLHAILSIGRKYDLQEEQFLRAALRSYQEMHENYFQEIEDLATEFLATIGQTYGWTDALSIPLARLKEILEVEYGYTLDMEQIATDPLLAKYRSVYVAGKKKRLYVNGRLYPWQQKFILARELGYCFLGLKERPQTSTPDQINSFAEILNEFKAGYFGGALLLPRAQLVADLEVFFQEPKWNPQMLSRLLTRYDVTPEMLLYRFSELIPEFFGVRLHFLRFHEVSNGRYHLIKELNMNQLLVPSGIGLQEHYCRRWLTVRLLKEMNQTIEGNTFQEFPVGVQLSEFLHSGDKFLCIGFARPLSLKPDLNSSVIVGFRVDANLADKIKWSQDPAIPRTIINETCERCPLTAEQCNERAVPPTLLEAEEHARQRKVAINQLVQG